VNAALPSSFDAFVGTPGYDCDISENAPAVLDGGQIIDAETRQARADALVLSERDRDWWRAILRRLKAGGDKLPTLREIGATASFAATTVSMRIAWRIAAEAGLMAAEECKSLVRTQAELIERELRSPRWRPDARQTLLEMQAEYRIG
jgi:hypothetical protein